jgi:hydrogenase maturation protease
VRLLEGRVPEGVVLLCHGGGATTLLPHLEAASAVWLVDAARSGSDAGTLHRFDAAAGPLPSSLAEVSSHGLGLAQALELARTLGTLPRRCIVYAIEGGQFAPGATLSPEVARAAATLARRILRELSKPGTGQRAAPGTSCQ